MSTWRMEPARASDLATQQGPAGPVPETGAARWEPTADVLLGRQAARESRARTYPRNIPISVARAEGVHIWDGAGRRYLDCLAGAGTLALGHNHPEVLAAMRGLLDGGLPLHTLDLPTAVRDEFITELFDALPDALVRHGRIQFCGPTGADAVEAAVKLVRTATGRRPMVAFHGSYHGMTQGALQLTGAVAPKEAVVDGGSVQFLPYPYEYRPPFGPGVDAGRSCGSYFEGVLNDPWSGFGRPAGVILEPVQGEGGVIPAPLPWLRHVRRVTAALGIPLILDEVQTGLGRTGHLWAMEAAGIVPDVVVLSKAIGGGLPVSVIVYADHLDVWEPGAHAGTFRGNQLAMAAGLATIRIVRREELAAHAAAVGRRLLDGLSQVALDHACMGDVRGPGLMIGVEIVEPDGSPDAAGTPPGDGATARRIQRALLERGVVAELGGRHGAVVRLLPPLILTAAQADLLVETFAEAVAAVGRGRGRPSR